MFAKMRKSYIGQIFFKCLKNKWLFQTVAECLYQKYIPLIFIKPYMRLGPILCVNWTRSANIWYTVFCLHSRDMIYLLCQHQNPWQQHCHSTNKICKQFLDHHNNYYIIMGNRTFKRTFQSHLDPDKIQTESKRSLIGCLCHSCFLWRPTVSILLIYLIVGSHTYITGVV